MAAAAVGGAGGGGAAAAVPFPVGQYKVKARFVVLHTRASPHNTILLGQGKVIGVETPGQTENLINGIIFGGETPTGDIIPDATKTEITFSRTFAESDMPQISRANGSRKNRRTTRSRRNIRRRINTKNSRINKRRI